MREAKPTLDASEVTPVDWLLIRAGLQLSQVGPSEPRHESAEGCPAELLRFRVAGAHQGIRGDGSLRTFRRILREKPATRLNAI